MSFPPAIPAAPTDEREEEYLAPRASHRSVMIGLVPFVWPQRRPDLKIRVVVAFAVLLVAKLVTVAVPVLVVRAREPAPGESLADFRLSPTWPGLAGVFPNGRDLYLPQCSHFLPMENPVLTAQLIRDGQPP